MAKDSFEREMHLLLHGGSHCNESGKDLVELARKGYATGGAVVPDEDDVAEPEVGTTADSMPPVAKKSGGKIHIKKSHEGDLSKKMGVPKKDNIPVDALKAEKKKAEKHGDEKLVKQTTFALNAKKWKK